MPDFDEKVYGRDGEVESILDHLRSEKKHGGFVAPTCFGKTYLIKKFLRKTLDADKVKDEFSGLFEKVIYLNCRENQLFVEIVRHFATLTGKKLEYQKDKETDFLKHNVFNLVQEQKILLIFDNFESWIGENGNYANAEVDIFINAFFNSNHHIRSLFVSQKLPDSEKDFFAKVKTLNYIGDKLSKGLSQRAALELVREEGEDVGLDKIPDKSLIEFFEKVFYIPQAIQSMIGFLRDEEISFSRFMKELWTEFEQEESDDKDLDHKLDKTLRPTKALLKRQILSQNDSAKHVLSLMAFFNVSAPEETLTIDLSTERERKEYRQALKRLKRNFLIQIETDTVKLIDEESGEETDIVYYFLHSYIKDIVHKVLPKFEEKYAENLEDFGDYLEEMSALTWEKRLNRKLSALADCKIKIEEYLVYSCGINRRLELLGRALLDKGVALHEINNADTAEKNPDALKKRLSAVENFYRKAIKLNPNDAMAHYNLGVLLAKDESRLKEAEESCRKAIELNPTHANAYINLGNLLAKDESRLKEAEEAYRKAIELNSTYALAYNNLGLLLVKDESRLKEAEESYRKAIELDPTYADTYYNLGVLLAKDESRGKESEESYREAIKLDPNYTDAYINLGNLLAEDEKRFEEAEAKYNKVIELNPNDALAYNNLGVLLYKQSKIDEAKKTFQTSVELDKSQVSSHIGLAAIYKKQGNQKESEKYAELVKVLLKEDDYYNSACLYSILDEKDESFKYLKLAIEKSSRYKSMAKTDLDFEWIRDDERFWEIVGRDDE